MSCGRPEDEGDEMPARPAPGSSSTPSICTKCRLRPVDYLKPGVGYCVECFVTTVERRFKDTMRYAREHCRSRTEKKKMRDSEKTSGNSSILIAVSDSLASRMTLDLLVNLYFPIIESQSLQIPAFSHCEVLHIQTGNEQDSVLFDLRKMVKDRVGWTFTNITEQDIYEGTSGSADIASSDLTLQSNETVAQFNPLHQQTTLSATSRQTLSNTVRSTHIAQYAASQGHRAIITCESATKLAARTLGAMATGQGYALGELVALVDVPVLGTDVRIYRPLGGVADDEVRFFASAKVRGWVDGSTTSAVATPFRSKKEGIEGLVEGFVRNLEIGFPSTVAVIGRTSGKLGMRSAAGHGAKKPKDGPVDAVSPCALCGLPADRDAQRWRQIASLSSLPQNALSSSAEPEHSSSSPQAASSTPNGRAGTVQTLADKLCYGCLVPFLEAQSKAKPLANPADYESIPALLPGYTEMLLANRPAQQEDERVDLRKEIEEYLL